jgi:hypothetical protein
MLYRPPKKRVRPPSILVFLRKSPGFADGAFLWRAVL